MIAKRPGRPACSKKSKRTKPSSFRLVSRYCLNAPTAAAFEAGITSTYATAKNEVSAGVCAPKIMVLIKRANSRCMRAAPQKQEGDSFVLQVTFQLYSAQLDEMQKGVRS